MPRFLAPNARAGDGRGYLTEPLRPLQPGDSEQTVARIAEARAMCDEPEALTAGQWLDHIDKRHKTMEEQRRKFEAARIEQERRLLSFEERLTTAHEEAQRRCIDISSEVNVLTRMKAGGKHVRHLENRLGQVERKVWRSLKDAA